ncbi:SDR family NAD(P)-dependent oxidoreductase [Hydrogenothermus marinus]|uniref:Short-subunit dehydrogenase n=1 Tax=Hydrogenothermus marinus TaxID=133270 RepID=A0A3M0BLE4_9AQUI|nr:SDR family NAD(P)-dependent oxidoreductase [Hydrogenothermus marinus]RMA97274.1 hypothetical protein CLV39_0932 [Hydrogenothermus marinus]
MEKICLITGVSRGLGKALANKFKKEGFIIIGVSRSKVDFDIDFHIQADITKKEDIERIIKEFEKNFDKLDVLINNAGIGLYESWKKTNEEDLRKLFELNFFAPVLLTQRFLKYLKKTKGTIINVSSVAGKMHIPYMGAYCSSKFALNAFSYSLRAELQPYDINVLNLIVGRIKTDFSSNALGSIKITPNTPVLGSSPEKFAEATYKAYKKRKREIVYPYWYKFLIYFSNLFPSIYDKLALKKWQTVIEE